jgi:beta-glucosidase
MKKSLLSCLLVCMVLQMDAQDLLPYKNASLPIPVRVKDLLQRMTPEEKFWQLFMIPGDLGADPGKYKNGLFGFQVNATAEQGNAAGQLLRYGKEGNALELAQKINHIQQYFVEQTRLGIPIIAFDEALHGLVRSNATSFPQAIGLAASWDTALMSRVANAIATETKARGIRQILTPVINIASDVRWGRTEETYGEDPFLTAEMGVAFIKAFEQKGIITTPKHFLANVGDGGRDSYPIYYNERQLDEMYLPPFKAAITRGGARSIMTSYNSIDGTPASANNWLLNQKLKKEWGFSGFVISDASAVGGANVLHFTAKDYADAGKQSISNGLDVIFQTAFDHYKLFIDPFLNGAIDSNRINDAVSRVLTAKFELGLFENPYVSEETAKEWISNSSHKALAKEASVKSMVLLKNEKNVLPISKKTKSIALIGVDAMEARLGGYSGTGNGKSNILQALLEKLDKKSVVRYSAGVGRKEPLWQNISANFLSTIVDGKTVPGLKGEYFSNLYAEGKPVLTRIDKTVDFNWTLYSPDKQLPTDQYSVQWTGKLKSPGTGTYQIGLDGNDGYRLYINNQLIVDKWQKQSYHTKLVSYSFEKDKSYAIKIVFYEPVGNAHIHLIWNAGVKNVQARKIQAAVEAASQSDIAIVVAGIEEGEFRDRALLKLPGRQEEMIEKIAATGKPVVVLLVGGSAVTMSNWIDKVQGVLDIWYPGEEGGHAVTSVLFGEENPGGKLPITFPLSEAQLPLVYHHKPTGRGDDYNNLSGLPLYPFGYGLSYTSFQYSNMKLLKQQVKSNETTTVKCTITNTGKRPGDEVVQLYIRDLLASVARPVLELKGFQRIHLKPGESKQVSFQITPEMLQMLNDKMETVVEPGDFRIMIGSSSRELWLKDTLSVLEN